MTTRAEDTGPASVDELRERIAQLEAENAALRTTGTLLRAVADHAPVVIYVKDRDGRFLLTNRQHAALLGLTPEQMAGKRERDILPEEIAATIDSVAETMFTSGEPQTSVFQIELSGQTRSFLELMFPIRDEAGQIIALGAISNDITDRQEREHALAASKAKSEFLAMMSHEIRTPMNAILGMTSLLFETELSSQQRELVEMAHSSSQSLLILLNDILDFSKIEAGKLDIEEAPVDVRVCLHRVVSLMEQTAAQKQIDLACDVAGGVPRLLLTDATRLRQIMLNLVNNGVKFTREGRVRVAMRGAHVGGDRYELHVSVADTGIGIPADRLSSLFQPFNQVDTSTTREYGGTGLGLAISKRLAEALGGRIWVESEVGVGSTFHCTIAARVGPDSDARSSGADEPAPRSGRRLSILLAEDNEVNRRVMQLMLEKLGHSADMATTGLEAVTKARSREYDAILMDVRMPEMDGLEAARQLRSQLPAGARPYIVALTANAMREDYEECIRAGMDDFLAKPVQVHQIGEALERAAAKRRQR
ncbi:MAG: ATP-binding protein [Polyangiaceae bacterium]